MGAAGGSEPDTYWINLISGTSHYASDIAVDSQKNVYSTFDSYGGSIPFVKFDKTGQLQFAKTINTPYSSSTGNKGIGIEVDSNDDIIIIGNAQTTGTTYAAGATFIGKYTSAGVRIWNRTFTGGNYHNAAMTKPFVNSSGDIFFAYRKRDSYYRYDILTVKYNSSGTKQFNRATDGPKASGEVFFEAGCVEDSNGNVYTCGSNKNSSSDQYAGFLFKYNSSGIFVSYKRFGNTSLDTRFRAIAVDSSDNIYCCGNQDNVGFVVKYDSSGNIVWSTKISNSLTFRGIAVDSSGDIYLCGGGSSVNGVYGTYSVVAKLNSSGQVQWYRKMSNSYISNRSLVVDNSAVYVTAYVKNGTSTQYNNATFKLPKDGSLTGTYGNFVYATQSYSISTPSNSNPTSTLFHIQSGSDSTVTYSDGNMTNTISTTTTL
jgi:hypothetical protein